MEPRRLNLEENVRLIFECIATHYPKRTIDRIWDCRHWQQKFGDPNDMMKFEWRFIISFIKEEPLLVCFENSSQKPERPFDPLYSSLYELINSRNGWHNLDKIQPIYNHREPPITEPQLSRIQLILKEKAAQK